MESLENVSLQTNLIQLDEMDVQIVQNGINGKDGNNDHTTSTSTSTASNGETSLSLSSSIKKETEWVRLNIGGQYFVTTKTTLCKNAHSFFFKLLQDNPSVGLTTDKVFSTHTICLDVVSFTYY